MFDAVRHPRQAKGYCLVRPDRDRPLESLSDVLGENGVQIEKVDRRAARITGRIGPTEGMPSCRVTLSLYLRLGLVFVEIVCETPAASPDGGDLACQVAWLKGRLRESLPLGETHVGEEHHRAPPDTRSRPLALALRDRLDPRE